MKTTTHTRTDLGVYSDTAPGQPTVQPTGSQISIWINQLSSTSVVVRERAREALVEFGHLAIGELLVTFQTAHGNQRWEACKALAEIADPASTPLLIRALESSHQDIRWVAAEGLINIGSDAVVPLLVALIDRAHAHTILKGAHHVLHTFAHRASAPIFEPVLAAIHGPQPGVCVPAAAEHALIRWRELAASVNDQCLLRSWRRQGLVS